MHKFKIYKELVGLQSKIVEIPDADWEEMKDLSPEEREKALQEWAFYIGQENLSNDDGEHVVFKIKKV